MSKPVPVTIVMERDRKRIRCIYINDHRVVGGKPYVSENLPHHFFEVDAERLESAGFVRLPSTQSAPNQSGEKT